MTLDLSMLDGIPSAVPATRQVAPSAPASAFEQDPRQPRFEFDDDEEFAALVADVGRRGILQPLVVRRLQSGVLRILFGARRYRAAVRAGLPLIPYVETEDERQFDDYAQVAENARRKPLQPLEQARFIERKLAQGQRKADVAAAMGIDASALTHLLALADAPPLLLELYYARRCRSPYYLYLLRKLIERDQAMVVHKVAEVHEITLSLIEDMARQLEERTAAPQPAGGAAVLQGEGSANTGTHAAVPSAIGSAPGKRRPTPVRQAPAPKIAVLTGHAKGRALRVLLDRVPDGEGQAWVEYSDDGHCVQMPLAELRLSLLRFVPAEAAEGITGRTGTAAGRPA